MSLNLYDRCPCGSGKKIKFCCSRDLAGELERVLRMVEGDQTAAALAKIQALEKKHPRHPALLALRMDAQWQLQQTEQLAATVDEFLEAAPDNPAAHAARAMLLAQNDRIAEALEAMQDSFERVVDEISPLVLQMALMVAIHAIRHEAVGPTEGLLRIYLAAADRIGDELDPRPKRDAAMLFYQIDQSRAVSLFHKRWDLAPPPAKASWKREYQLYWNNARQGQFRRAAEGLEEMAKRILDEPVILRSQVALNWWLDRIEQVKGALRALSKVPTLPYAERVEALAGAQELDLTDRPQWTMTYALTDADQALQLLDAHSLALAIGDRPTGGSDQGPPPRKIYNWLDRPQPDRPADQWTVDELPEILAIIQVYGRETDRPARLEVETLHGESDLPETLRAALQGELGERLSVEEAPDRYSPIEGLVRPELLMPTPPFNPAPFFQTTKKAILQRVRERLADLPLPELDGQTVRQAASQNASKLAAQAVLVRTEAMADQASLEVDVQSLREELGLPSMGPSQFDDPALIDRARPAELLRVDPHTLADRVLHHFLLTAVQLQMGVTVRRAGQEILDRPDSDDQSVAKLTVCRILASSLGLDDRALEYLQRGREIEVAQGGSPAMWLVDELELRILRGEIERGRRLLDEIRLRHMRSPGVAERLRAAFQRIGITPSRERPEGGEEERPDSAETRPESQIWTPGAEGAGGQEPEPSKLWVPGQ